MNSLKPRNSHKTLRRVVILGRDVGEEEMTVQRGDARNWLSAGARV